MDLSPLSAVLQHLEEVGFAPWVPALAALTEQRLVHSIHGDLPRWSAALASMPRPGPGRAVLDAPAVGVDGPLEPADQALLRDALMALHPWRKGPYRLYGVEVDSEWRSDWKWERIAPHLAPLHGRKVLDVGCGNGYHCWRALGAGAGLVLGLDPGLLYVVQSLAVAGLMGDSRAAVLPLALEELPADLSGFDTVLSMGVLYHRRLPLDHLRALHRLLRPGGQLVLETLVVDGDVGEVLVPAGRYARMRNVWSIPTVKTLADWIGDCGFRAVGLVDLTPTTTEEQRSTDWMRFESLAQALHPQDSTRTVEGLPAPLRAVVLASG